MSDVHEGGCLCRAIRYRVTGDPMRVSACYCTFCQRRTGGALSIHAFFDEQNIELIGDGLTTYVRTSLRRKRSLVAVTLLQTVRNNCDADSGKVSKHPNHHGRHIRRP
jgi:hypothetical protein